MLAKLDEEEQDIALDILLAEADMRTSGPENERTGDPLETSDDNATSGFQTRDE
jgi:hypothetical protein